MTKSNKIKTVAELVSLAANTIMGISLIVEKNDERNDYVKIRKGDIAELSEMLNELQREVEKEAKWFPHNNHLVSLKERIELIKAFGSKAISEDC